MQPMTELKESKKRCSTNDACDHCGSKTCCARKSSWSQTVHPINRYCKICKQNFCVRCYKVDKKAHKKHGHHKDDPKSPKCKKGLGNNYCNCTDDEDDTVVARMSSDDSDNDNDSDDDDDE